MKRFWKCSLCFILAVVLCVGCSVAVFADSQADAPFQNYFMLCDSIAIKRASGLGPDIKNDPAVFRKDSYPDIIKTQLRIPSSYTCGHEGWRVEEALYAIGGEDLSNEWVLDNYGGQPKAKLESLIGANIAALENADLITINLGSNNLVTPLAYALMSAFEMEHTAFGGSKCDRAVVEALNKAKNAASDLEAVVIFLEAVETLDRGKVLLQNALRDLPTALKDFPTVWNKLIRRIREVNSEAKIVVVGMYNPVGNVVNKTINDNLSLGILGKTLTKGLGEMLRLATEPTIKYIDNYMHYGSPCASEYVYADVSGVDLTGSNEGVHLGAPGQAYFAQQILKVIENNFVCRHADKTVKNARKATLLIPGYSGDTYCDDCGKLIAKGHTTFWFK